MAPNGRPGEQKATTDESAGLRRRKSLSTSGLFGDKTRSNPARGRDKSRPYEETKKPADLAISGLLINPGSVLLSHSLAAAVSSALEDLTSVFGMGTGVTPPAWPPGGLMIV